MQKIVFYFILFMAARTTPLTAQNRPDGLLCNLLATPEQTLITDGTPTFGWVYSAARKNDLQTAFQILVADSKVKIEQNCGNVWDSGKVTSSQSINVEYGGAALASFSSYYWTVRTWNLDDESSLYATAQQFHTGEISQRYVTATYPLEKRRVEPVQFLEKKPGCYFIDFGRAAFGTIEIQFGGKIKTDSFIVHLGEKLSDTRTIDRHPGGTIRYRKIRTAPESNSSILVVTISPDKRNTGARAIKMPPDIGEVLPFRYCEIEKSPVRLDKNSVTMIAVNYPFDDDASFFECSDPVLNDVWELCKYSIKAASFCGVYVDGDRERIPYEADAYINQLCHYSVDREYSMARYSHEYLIKNATWPTEWILHSVFMAWADFLYTGDKASIEFYYDDLKAKTLLALARDDGLISTQTGLVTPDLLAAIHLTEPLRDIVDWPPGSFMFGGIGERDNYHMGKINTVVNAFFYQALTLMSRIAAVLERTEDAELFQSCAEKVKNSINKKLFDPQQNLYVDCEDSTHAALHANMFPLAFGLAPPERVTHMVEFIKSRGMACSVYGAQYLLEALYRSGEAQYALDLMTARHDRSWPHMIYDVGSTITLEAWDQKYKKNLDWNHAWGAAPANIIPRYLIGVLPVEPGFTTFQIKPQIANLAYARAKVPTIRGAVFISIQQDDSSYRLEVTVPGNSVAHVYVPVFSESQRVTVNGAVVEGVREGNTIAFKNFAAGDHSFVVRK